MDKAGQKKKKKRNEGDTTISGCKEHGLVMGLGSSGWWLGLILKVFSNVGNSMILPWES